MRIVFFGSSDIGYRCCEAILAAGEQVVGMFSVPREFRVSYSSTPVKNVQHRSFEPLSKAYGVPLVRVDTSLTDARYLRLLDEWHADFGLAIGWYHMVPHMVRDRFTKGVAGIHASLLPRYRGGAPLVWAIINGEAQAGVTLFYFDDGVDSGDIIAQSAFEILRDDTIATVCEKATTAAVELARTHVAKIRMGVAQRIPQDHACASQFPQRRPEDGLIDWNKSAEETRNFIRAQTRPYPGAFTIVNGKKITIWDADVAETE